MSGANYEYCPSCDSKALYTGEDDVPDGVVVIHAACLESELAKAAIAERERLRLAVFGCTACGKVHEPRDTGVKFQAPSWASPDDGHPYSPAHVSHRAGLESMLADLLRETP